MKILQLGLGAWGKNHHRILTKMGHKVYSFDIANNSYELFATYSKMNLDAVVITTSSVNHFPLIQNFLKKEIPIYCEKPICLSRFQLNQLPSFDNQIFQSGHQLLFHPEIYDPIFLDKKILYLYATRMGAIAREEGAIMSLAIHDIAIILRLMKWQMPSSIEAKGTLQSCKVILHFKKITAEILVQANADIRVRDFIAVLEEGQYIHISPDNWNRHDLLDRALKHFMQAVGDKRPPTMNNLEHTIKIMQVVLTAKEELEK